jgi:hypothetical protein
MADFLCSFFRFVSRGMIAFSGRWNRPVWIPCCNRQRPYAAEALMVTPQHDDRHRIVASVDIARPAEVVYDYLRDIERRLRINPSYRLTGFEWLTPGAPRAGSRYRVRAAVGDTALEYLCELVEQVDGKSLVTRNLDTAMTVRLTVTPRPGGCRLTHEEEFAIPEEALQPKPNDLRAMMARLFAALADTDDRVPLDESERAARTRAIVSDMEQRLRRWLERVREAIERAG